MITIKINVKKTCLKFMILFFLFQNALIEIIPDPVRMIIEYSDEFIALFMLVAILVRYKMINSLEKHILAACFGIVFLGLVSSVIHRIQPLFPTVVDGIVCSRFFLIFVGFHIYWRRSRYTKCIFDELNTAIRVIGVVLFLLVIFNIFVYQIFPVFDYRLFIHSQKLFFRNTADLAFVCMIGLIIMVLNSRYHKGNIFYMILYSMTAVSTMRYKELAIIITVWLMYLYLIVGRIRSRRILIMGAVLAVAVFGYDQFSLYYRNNEQARFLMMYASILIANRFFPLGAGFASFGSHMSGVYYSPLYAEYGLSRVWGLSKSNIGFISDNFFSLILGQFGWIGLIIIIRLFYVLLRECFRIKDQTYFVTAISLVLYLCISSFGTSSIFNPIAVCIAITLSNLFATLGDNGLQNEGC